MNVRLFYLAMIFGLVGFADPVFGCSCIGGVGLGQHFKDAVVVFAGRPTVVRLGVMHSKWHPRPIEVTVVTFRVDTWYKGRRGKSVVVRTGMGGGDCGSDFRVGRRYIIFARKERHHLWTGICSGNRSYIVGSPEVTELEGLAKSTE